MPRAFDQISKEHLLIDSGAQISVWPRSRVPEAKLDPYVSIRAVNKTKILTYGKYDISVRFGRKQYNHTVILADVDQPVLGWDFCKKFRLSLLWTWLGDLELWDRLANIHIPLQITKNQAGKWPNLEGFALHDSNNLSYGDPWETTLPNLQENEQSLFELFACEVEQFRTFREYANTKKQETHKATDLSTLPEAYRNLLSKYPNVLTCNFKAKEVKHGVSHRIETGNNSPCKAKCRPLMPGSPKYMQAEKDLKKLVDMGIIKPVNPSDSNIWTSALHLAPKPDGTFRVCGDFRDLNSKTIMDGFPLPNIRTFMGQIKGSKIFSRVDLVKAFHQIPLDPTSQAKSTIVTPWGAFQFSRLPMGLKNSAQSFQRLMTHILGDVPGLFCYLDDVLVYSKSQEEHMHTLQTLLYKLHEAGLAISLDKCIFGVDNLEFLGYRVDNKGITPLPKKLSAISNFPAPKKPKHLLGYLGALNYYRRCLPKTEGKTPAEILQPLYTAATTPLPPKMTFVQYWKTISYKKALNCQRE